MTNSFWDAIEPVYDGACQKDSLARWDWDELKEKYISDRKYNEFIDIKAMRSRLPKELLSCDFGPNEIDLVDFLLNYKGDRVITLEGPRGSGKTSMLHYIEAAIYKSRYKSFPIFLIIDCLAKEQNVSKYQIIKLLIDEVKKLLHKVKGIIHSSFEELIAEIEGDMTFSGASRAFSNMAQKLPSETFNRIIVVFDNLDQNYLDSICHGIELAKEIYKSSKVSTITCLRPGCLEAITYRGDARAFFNYKIKVTAPKTIRWIEALGPKMSVSAQKLKENTGNILRAYDKKIQPEKIELSINNFVKLLEDVKYDDVNVLNIMDAVAADDIRHLVLLTRRLLGHRQFPGMWVLDFDKKYPDYHPLISLLEGNSFIFEKNKVIPNLLSFSDTTSRCDFLISHRILLILNTNDHKTPHSSKKLLHSLNILGHDDHTIINCLAYLHELLLIRSTDAEFVDPKATLPTAFFLTESGRLFLNHLLCTKDYLLTTVLDVSLEHTTLKKSLRKNPNTIKFSDQLDSLLEYIEKVKLEEEAQINRLIESSINEFAVLLLSLFKNGGLLCRQLLEGLESTLESVRYSKFPSAYNTCPILEVTIKSISKWIEDMGTKLNEAYLKKITAKITTPQTITLSHSAKLLILPSGNEVSVSAEMSLPCRVDSVLIGILGQIDNKTIATSTIAKVETKHERSSINAVFGTFSTDQTDTIKLHANAVISHGGNRKKLGLLSMNNLGCETMQLSFHVMSPDKHDCKPFIIGKKVNVDDIKELSNNFFQGELNFDKPELLSKEKILILGTKLANATLSDEGQNVLATHFKLINSLVVFSSDNNLTIPWEWLRPQPVRNHSDVSIIGDIWDIVRWPISTENDIISCISSLAPIVINKQCSNLCTIGLERDPLKEWRHETPKTFKDLLSIIENKDILHLIGHCDKESGKIKIGDLIIDNDTINAFPLYGPKVVILSSCSTAVVPFSSNVAINISKRSRTMTWAPIVPISKKCAIKIDSKLKEYIECNPMTSIDKFFMENKKTDALFLMYVKYAVN